MNTPHRYTGYVKNSKTGAISGPYSDYFNDDEDAQEGYRLLMQEQGYSVKSVTITEDKTATVEI